MEPLALGRELAREEGASAQRTALTLQKLLVMTRCGMFVPLTQIWSAI